MFFDHMLCFYLFATIAAFGSATNKKYAGKIFAHYEFPFFISTHQPIYEVYFYQVFYYQYFRHFLFKCLLFDCLGISIKWEYLWLFFKLFWGFLWIFKIKMGISSKSLGRGCWRRIVRW